MIAGIFRNIEIVGGRLILELEAEVDVNMELHFEQNRQLLCTAPVTSHWSTKLESVAW
jgi:hypothetical protein